MTRAVWWKEYREHRAVWFALAGLGAVTLAVLASLLRLDGVTALNQPDRLWPLMYALGAVAATYGLVCGAMLLASEREAGTLPLLDAWTARRTPVWRAKLLVGLGLTLTQAVLLTGLIVGLAELRSWRQRDRKGCAGCMNGGFCNFCMGRAYLSTGDPLAPAGVLCHQATAKASLHRGRPAATALAPLPWEPGLVQIRRAG